MLTICKTKVKVTIKLKLIFGSFLKFLYAGLTRHYGYAAAIAVML